MIQIWRCQWGTEKQIKEWRESGVPMLTAERLQTTMQHAYELGVEAGKVKGAYELRKGIEEGRFEPIGPLASPSQDSHHGQEADHGQ